MRGRPRGRDFHRQKQAKGLSVPTHECLRAHDRYEIAPGDELGEQHQRDP